MFSAILLKENGLRDYGTALWDGGDAACGHVATSAGKLRRDSYGGVQNSTSRGTQASTIAVAKQYRDTCGKCGAVRIDRQIGLEATPDEYLATMVAVFREVKRVLRPDGTVWCNLGDSYAGGPSHAHEGMAALGAQYRGGGHKATRTDKPDRSTGLAAKQLLLMPARLALALQADGWWVRSDIIWHKPNPMPESVTDRCVSAHEHVFMLTKAPRYYFDAEAIREPQSEGTIERFGNGNAPRRRAVKQGGTDRQCDTWHDPVGVLPNGRSCRNVWTIATSPFSSAHFATFPPELAERCIRAGTSEKGCCAQCGAPWRRVTDATYEKIRPTGKTGRRDATGSNGWDGGGYPHLRKDVTTTGWQPGCDHGAEVVPCRVLDPFAGAGTTLLVADRLQRDAIGIELNVAYTQMAMDRCIADAPLFADMHPPPAEDPEDERMRDLFAEAAE